jgi:hypothetical protein
MPTSSSYAGKWLASSLDSPQCGEARALDMFYAAYRSDCQGGETCQCLRGIKVIDHGDRNRHIPCHANDFGSNGDCATDGNAGECVGHLSIMLWQIGSF